jgi:hypothetical protein
MSLPSFLSAISLDIGSPVLRGWLESMWRWGQILLILILFSIPVHLYCTLQILHPCITFTLTNAVCLCIANISTVTHVVPQMTVFPVLGFGPCMRDSGVKIQRTFDELPSIDNFAHETQHSNQMGMHLC